MRRVAKNTTVMTFKVANIELHDDDYVLEDQIVRVERDKLKTHMEKFGTPVNASDMAVWELNAMNHISDTICLAFFGQQLDIVDCKITKLSEEKA